MTDKQSAEDEPLATIVRRTVDKMTETSAKGGQDTAIWDYVHLTSVIGWLDTLGHRDAVLDALGHAAATYDVEVQGTPRVRS